MSDGQQRRTERRTSGEAGSCVSHTQFSPVQAEFVLETRTEYFIVFTNGFFDPSCSVTLKQACSCWAALKNQTVDGSVCVCCWESTGFDMHGHGVHSGSHTACGGQLCSREEVGSIFSEAEAKVAVFTNGCKALAYPQMTVKRKRSLYECSSFQPCVSNPLSSGTGK